MRLSLRRQLLIIGLLALVLPWLSLSYIRETETALRDAQADFLASLASGMAANLQPSLADQTGTEYVFALARAPLLDGFIDDWLTGVAPRPIGRGEVSVQMQLGEFEGGLWLYVETAPWRERAVSLQFHCTAEGRSVSDEPAITYTFEPEAPGRFTIPSGSYHPSINGIWNEGSQRTRLEARLPLQVCGAAFAFSIRIDEQTVSSVALPKPARLIRHNPEVERQLDRALPLGVDRFVVNADGWRITRIIGSRPGANESRVDSNLLRALYRRIIGDSEPTLRVVDAEPRIMEEPIISALSGKPAQRRARDSTGRITTVAATPLMSGSVVAGALVLRQDTAAILSLNNPSVLKLTQRTVVVTAAVVGLLLAWATWVSWRIRRLARAAGSALDSQGQLSNALPGQKASDEIGILARDFSTLLERVGEQQQWLRSLADKLSHELRTPMAVVQSSLDNLREASLTDAQLPLHERASSGVARLHAILNAMSQANRAEQTVADAEYEAIDLTALMTQLTMAYQQTFTTHQWRSNISNDIRVHGNADLLVQLLDKVVDNAVSFSPANEWIEVQLSRSDSGSGPLADITITNFGASLPPGDPRKLFQTMVTQRSGDDTGTPHLGFGLYIAALIANAHQGVIEASDVTVDDQRGVAVRIRLPMHVAT
ncbi:MAG: ATP-binding protein [Pseudomonadota bacterium]